MSLAAACECYGAQVIYLAAIRAMAGDEARLGEMGLEGEDAARVREVAFRLLLGDLAPNRSSAFIWD